MFTRSYCHKSIIIKTAFLSIVNYVCFAFACAQVDINLSRTFCIFTRTSAVDLVPLANRSLSRLATLNSPALYTAAHTQLNCTLHATFSLHNATKHSLNKSKYAYHSCTAPISGIGSPGLLVEAMWLAHARPKTTRSSSELAPSRLAPCTDTQAASPAAYSPGTTWSSPFFCVSTCSHTNTTAHHCNKQRLNPCSWTLQQASAPTWPL